MIVKFSCFAFQSKNNPGYKDVEKLIELIREHYTPISIGDNPLPVSSPLNGSNSSKSSKIVGIYLYPVKSCGPMKITKSWPVSESGLAHDRSFVIMQGSKVLTQKSLSMLCLIRCGFVHFFQNVFLFKCLFAIKNPLTLRVQLRYK